MVQEANMGQIGDDVHLAHTALSADELRNRPRPTVTEEEGSAR